MGSIYETYGSGRIPRAKKFIQTANKKIMHKEHPSVQDMREDIARIEENQRNAPPQDWQPVKGQFPRLVFKTKKNMGDFNAPDMLHGDETKEQIMQHGLFKPFEPDLVQLTTLDPMFGGVIGINDEFSLPASVHFKRMRGLAKLFSNEFIANLAGFKTAGVYPKMVDKFERNEGLYFSHPLLDDGLRDQDTTQAFHNALKKCLSKNISDGHLDSDIMNISNKYLSSSDKGVDLPQFDMSDIFKGTVLAVHGIWSMEVYVDELEYKGKQIRGKFRYIIEDHFGLDTADIDSTGKGALPPYEWMEGFRSWYLLQHYKGYGYKPFITRIKFKL